MPLAIPQDKDLAYPKKVVWTPGYWTYSQISQKPTVTLIYYSPP
ncbi:hypothetical protein [Sphingobacterium sp.]|nr:hypothetical protein [Sphingobacterium sp.]